MTLQKEKLKVGSDNLWQINEWFHKQNKKKKPAKEVLQ